MKYKYILKVVKGTFAGDQWSFSSLEEIDSFIVERRNAGIVRAFAPQTMEIWRGRRKIGER